RFVSVGHLDGLGHVSWLRVRISSAANRLGRSTIGPHHSFLRVHTAVTVPPGSHFHGLVCRIPNPHARDDHRARARGNGGTMSQLSRRKLIAGGAITAVGASGLVVAAKLAARFGLVPPDSGGLYGPGETFTYAAQRLVNRHALAREFTRSQISAQPFANLVDPPLGEEFRRLEQGAFSSWRLQVDGMVARPASFSLAEIKSFAARTQITHLACEEGWSYIAEWKGVP